MHITHTTIQYCNIINKGYLKYGDKTFLQILVSHFIYSFLFIVMDGTNHFGVEYFIWHLKMYLLLSLILYFNLLLTRAHIMERKSTIFIKYVNKLFTKLKRHQTKTPEIGWNLDEIGNCISLSNHYSDCKKNYIFYESYSSTCWHMSRVSELFGIS